MALKDIISASRRTDIPAYYLDRLAGWVSTGFAPVTNPYSGVITQVSLDPERVHTMVLWSKNFGPFLSDGGFLDPYHLYFLFTLNDMPFLEPALPPLAERLRLMSDLAMRHSSERIGWRFDPIVFDSNGPVTPLESFTRIAREIADSGVTRLIVSFLDFYGKVRKRNTNLGLGLVDPPDDMKRDYLFRLIDIALPLGFTVETCCENTADIPGITQAACIDGKLLAHLAGEPARTARDTGQRSGCRCTISRDIGSYHDMPCPTGCRYCYANPCIPQYAGGAG